MRQGLARSEVALLRHLAQRPEVLPISTPRVSGLEQPQHLLPNVASATPPLCVANSMISRVRADLGHCVRSVYTPLSESGFRPLIWWSASAGEWLGCGDVCRLLHLCRVEWPADGPPTSAIRFPELEQLARLSR